MNKTIEELQAAVEKAEANWMVSYAADAAAARAARAAAARAARAAAASDAAWRTLFDAREAAKTALAEKESK